MNIDAVEERLLGRQLPDLLPREEEWVLPHYDGFSIANLPATIAALLRAQAPGQGEPSQVSLPGALPPVFARTGYRQQRDLTLPFMDVSARSVVGLGPRPRHPSSCPHVGRAPS